LTVTFLCGISVKNEEGLLLYLDGIINHMNILNSGLGSGVGFGAFLGPGLLLILIWSLFWKGLALWHAGRRGQPWWFVVMLVINTIGILEIIYLFAVLKLKFSELFNK